jgi:membrane-bound lytic murein transglycosylase A
LAKSAEVVFKPAAFADVPGWSADDLLPALAAFVRSSGPVLASARVGRGPQTAVQPPPGLLEVCRAARSLDLLHVTAQDARRFFEARFRPYRVVHAGAPGLLTGYYEPELDGSRMPADAFRVPVYRRPPDLVNLVAEAERGAVGEALTHARKTDNGFAPYATRAEIESGALDGRGLELLWLKDPVDAFFMHIQGSGCIRLAGGETIRITYDGKNGHPYTSIGRYLIECGLFPADRMSLDALKSWLKADPERARGVMWQNKSFVFFRELTGDETDGPLGALGIPLSEGRSLAVDTAYHALGTPIFVSAPELKHTMSAGGFQRLMIAQDVGSAIRGPERGDIYFGSGDAAGRLAGVTKHPGVFFVLLPCAAEAS